MPRQVVCTLPDGTRVGRLRVRPGRGFRLTVCVPTDGALCDGDTFSSRRLRILRTGRACGRVEFQERTEDLASQIRAAGVRCRVAKAVASRSKPEARRCFARGSRAYRAEGFRCRGTADKSALPRVIFRCIRRGARVTFVKT